MNCVMLWLLKLMYHPFIVSYVTTLLKAKCR